MLQTFRLPAWKRYRLHGVAALLIGATVSIAVVSWLAWYPAEITAAASLFAQVVIEFLLYDSVAVYYCATITVDDREVCYRPGGFLFKQLAKGPRNPGAVQLFQRNEWIFQWKKKREIILDEGSLIRSRRWWFVEARNRSNPEHVTGFWVHPATNGILQFQQLLGGPPSAT